MRSLYVHKKYCVKGKEYEKVEKYAVVRELSTGVVMFYKRHKQTFCLYGNNLLMMLISG